MNDEGAECSYVGIGTWWLRFRLSRWWKCESGSIATVGEKEEQMVVRSKDSVGAIKEDEDWDSKYRDRGGVGDEDKG